MSGNYHHILAGRATRQYRDRLHTITYRTIQIITPQSFGRVRSARNAPEAPSSYY